MTYIQTFNHRQHINTYISIVSFSFSSDVNDLYEIVVEVGVLYVVVES